MAKDMIDGDLAQVKEAAAIDAVHVEWMRFSREDDIAVAEQWTIGRFLQFGRTCFDRMLHLCHDGQVLNECSEDSIAERLVLFKRLFDFHGVSPEIHDAPLTAGQLSLLYAMLGGDEPDNTSVIPPEREMQIVLYLYTVAQPWLLRQTMTHALAQSLGRRG